MDERLKIEEMSEEQYIIESNAQLTHRVWRMVLRGNTEAITMPGQFVNIQLPGLYLRRPISVCDWEVGKLTIVYKVVGRGTEMMSRMQAGQELDVLTGLGHGFEVEQAGSHPLLIGGGVGVPPLQGLARRLMQERQTQTCTVILGFNTQSEVILADEFSRLGCRVIVVTMDGTYGQKGLVTDVIPSDYSYYYTCGPLPMLKAVMAQASTPGQVSMEERMGCGFGICMGSSIETGSGPKRVCKEGPVFFSEELRVKIEE